MKDGSGQHPSPGARLLEIAIGLVALVGIAVLLIGSSVVDLAAAYDTGVARFTRGRPVAFAERPVMFWSIIASKVFVILLGIGAAVVVVSSAFLRRPPIRW
jgi:hypothetical protein